MMPRTIAIVRILIGIGFLALGINRLMDPAFLYGGLMSELAEHGKPYWFYENYFLDRFVELHQELFAYGAAIAAVLLGISFLSGALVSLGSVGGAAMTLSFGLATSAGGPVRMAVCGAGALVFVLLGRYGAGLTWGVDGWLAEHIHEGIVLFPLRGSLPPHFSPSDSDD